MEESKKKNNPRDSNSNVFNVIRLWIAFNFFIAPIRDGLNPFVSVYLVAVLGLSPGIAGIIWFVRDLALMISQVPFGFVFDYTAKKKLIVFLCTTVCAFTPLAIILSKSVPILVIKTILEGVASSGLAVAKGPFTLGIAGHELFGITSKNTEVAEHMGAFFAALGAGCVAYTLFPNVKFLFYVIALFGCIASMCILFMPTRSTPDNDGNTFIILDDALACNSKKTTNDDKLQSKLDDEALISTWKTFSTDKNLLFFALAIFLFHLGNAAILPLLGQAIALRSGRAGIPYTAANIVVAQVSSIGAALAMNYYVTKGTRINIPILIGFGSQALRIGLILVLSYYWPNEYALIATQLLDGLGAGVNGLATMLVTKFLTVGTNKFGLVFSVVNMSGFCGGALSNLISGFIVTATSYEIGFIFLLVPIVLSLLLINLLEVPTDWDRSAEKVDDSDDELDDEYIMSQILVNFPGTEIEYPHSKSFNMRHSIQVSAMNRPGTSPAANRRASEHDISVKKRRSSSIFGLSSEVTITQPTKGRRLSSIKIK
eukprot:CAMPEP_0194284228 /NCGR_PEP_ID=MMETSP0169-20130528/27084_1 /TAXON_ID=218684 /ORGANISM="Corethron pennatum, Strain L29A3" /LENGTH=541 /DNA_ID=CAMNT_0039029993 /DNA_START=234 /DNA_END=1856 /DNA_ORIENTATION=-